MTWFQRVMWVLLVGGAVFAVVLLAGRDLNLGTDDIILPAFGVMGVVGAWLSVRRPSSPIGWLFLAAGTASALLMWASAVVQETAASGGPWEGTAALAALWVSVAWYLVVAVCIVYVPLLFPDGPLSPAWHRVVVGLVVGQVAFVVLVGVSQQLEPIEGVFIPNPLAFPTTVLEDVLGEFIFVVGLALLPIGSILGLISLVQRYRRADAVARLQLRWFVAAVALLLLSVITSLIAWGVLPAGSSAEALVEIFFGLSLVALPIACAVAVLRYRLYEIDRIISRTLSYLIVSLLVAGTYALVVTSATTLLQESNALAVAGATLAAAAVFRPVLRRVQWAVDHRFNRARFDAAHEVDEFAARLRDSVDPDTAVADLSAVVKRTLQPAALGLWTIGADR